MVNDPTQHPEVNILLAELLDGTQAILGEQFVGMYLFGSLASGDFDAASDVDVLIVTDSDVGEDRFVALQMMHERLATRDSVWATQLEVSYIPARALRHYDPTDANHPHLDRGSGERLALTIHDSAWIVQRHVLREHGIIIKGESPQALIDTVTPDDLRRAMLDALRGWASRILANPDQIAGRGYQSYVVLTVCRILYTLECGDVVSKPVAAAQRAATLGAPWDSLIERALIGRHNSGLPAEPDDVYATLALIRLALQRSPQLQTNPTNAN